MRNNAKTNPATGEILRTYPTYTDTQVGAAVDRAHASYRDWGRSSTVAERSSLLSKVAQLFQKRRDELAEIIMREVGKPISSGLGEVDTAVTIFQYYADKADEFLADQ